MHVNKLAEMQGFAQDKRLSNSSIDEQLTDSRAELQSVVHEMNVLSTKKKILLDTIQKLESQKVVEELGYGQGDIVTPVHRPDEFYLVGQVNTDGTVLLKNNTTKRRGNEFRFARKATYEDLCEYLFQK